MLDSIKSREDDISEGVTPTGKKCLFGDKEEVSDLSKVEPDSAYIKQCEKMRAIHDRNLTREEIKMIAEIDDECFEELRRLANHDKITGLPNFRAYLNGAGRIISLAQRREEECAVLMVDLDCFKNVNDSLGHPSGNKVLNKIAQILQDICRESDLVARYGGDEFIVALPEINIENARALAERIREAVGDKMIKYGVTSSIGVAGSSQIKDLKEKTNADVLEELNNLADKALYKAKKRGRNQVVTISLAN
jgi:two-component system, cell cycle response regulator